MENKFMDYQGFCSRLGSGDAGIALRASLDELLDRVGGEKNIALTVLQKLSLERGVIIRVGSGEVKFMAMDENGDILPDLVEEARRKVQSGDMI